MTDAATPIITLTEAAREVVREARADEVTDETPAEELGLYIEINGVSGAAFTYDMYFQPLADAGPGDAVEDHDGISVIVESKTISRLRGATLGVDEDGDLHIANPNSPSPAVGAASTPAAEPSSPAMAEPAVSADRPLLTITEAARAIVVDARSEEAEPEKLALWLEVSGESGGQFTYDMYFQALDDADDGDAVEHDGDIPIVVPAGSVDRIRGATLDVATSGSGMVIINPNTPRPYAPDPNRPQADLSGEIPQRILKVLEEQINPSIASHGGRAELVAVEDDTAYLRLGGGCQGCGLAKVTLSEGIAVAVQREVPEIRHVVDVTDHASGQNPYYEPSKK